MALFTIKVVHTIELAPDFSDLINRLIAAIGPGPDVTILQQKLSELESKTGTLQEAVARNQPSKE